MGVVIAVARRLFRRREIDLTSGCWLWRGDCSTRDGYGRVRQTRGRKALVHRLAFESFVGPIPAGMRVLHRCDTPACFNPEHLFLGTDFDNMRDMAAKGRGYVPRGELAPRAKLTAASVSELRSRQVTFGSISRWAREFGVSRRAIRLALDGATWK